MNEVFTAIQNRDGAALVVLAGHQPQPQHDSVVNMSAEQLVDALFRQLKQLFPAAEHTNLRTPAQEAAAKQQWIAAFAEGGVRTREQLSAGINYDFDQAGLVKFIASGSNDREIADAMWRIGRGQKTDGMTAQSVSAAKIIMNWQETPRVDENRAGA